MLDDELRLGCIDIEVPVAHSTAGKRLMLNKYI
jgi:hypothetical protein